MSVRRSSRVAGAIASALSVLSAVTASGLVLESAAVATVPVTSVSDDAVAFVPVTGDLGAVRRGSSTVPFTRFGTDWAFGGQFDDASGGDVFLYNPGSAPDGILHVAPSGGSVVTSFRSLPVRGDYRPVVGDFDANGISDVLWYAAGPARDSLWLFDASGAHSTVALTINGTFRPTVVDANADGRDDIIWYAPGSAPDVMWLMGPGALSHTNKALVIGGDYITAVGALGVPAPGESPQRVVWYNASGKDWVWRFNAAGTPSSSLLPALDGDYQPLVGQFIEESYGTIFWYRPGSGAERIWAFGPGPGADVSVLPAPAVYGTYVPVVADLDTNGFSDIVWSSSGKATSWRFTATGLVSSTVTGLPADGLPVAVDMD